MQPSADPIRVLTVDPAAADTLDDADDRFDVVAATDSDEALAMLDRETFDCVVAPADLPDASGLDLLELVRARAPEPPFVVTAADGSEALASRAIAAGVTDYVPTGNEVDLGARVADAVARETNKRTGGDRPPEREAGTIEREDSGSWQLTPAQYHDVFATAEVGIGIIDPETGTFEQVNRRWDEMLGYDHGEIVGKSVAAISADDPSFDQDAAMERIRMAIDGTPQQFDWLHERADGSTVWCEVNLKRTRIGDEVRLLAFLRNVADRKERQRDLEFFETLVESVGIGVAAYDASGQFVYVNDRFAENLGTDRDRVAAVPVWEIAPDLDADRFDGYWASFDVGDTRTFERILGYEQGELGCSPSTAGAHLRKAEAALVDASLGR